MLSLLLKSLIALLVVSVGGSVLVVEASPGASVNDADNTINTPSCSCDVGNSGDSDGGRADTAPVPPPVKIFLLAGQSNMQGHGWIDAKNETTGKMLNATLEWLVKNDPNEYGFLLQDDSIDKDGNLNWTENHNVMIAYNYQDISDVRPEILNLGYLKPGYGGPDARNHVMGPELGFGWTVSNGLLNDAVDDSSNNNQKICNCQQQQQKQQILLIKIAWGGRSLAIDFRPPSSGVPKYGPDANKKGTSGTGLYYTSMLATTYKVLGNLHDYLPNYKGSYELAGFVWHQGWNDGCDKNMTKEYEFNLANLIRDLRVDLGKPDLKVAIGVSGMLGYNKRSQDRIDIINAQFAMMNSTKYPDFKGTVEVVETRDFHRDEEISPSGYSYHWNANCESYWLVGQAMGEAMLRLLGIQQQQNSKKSIISQQQQDQQQQQQQQQHEKKKNGATVASLSKFLRQAVY